MMYDKVMGLGRVIADESRAINEALGPTDVLVTAACFFALICEVDWVTSYELSMNPLYLLLVIFVTWRCGWKWGLVFAFGALANQVSIGLVTGYPFSKPFYFVAASIERLFSSVVIVALLTRLRMMYDAGEKKLQR
jgi:hypothetical protein